MNLRKLADRTGVTAVMAAALFVTAYGAHASTMNLPETPLFLSQSSPPLNMLVLGRDHKLYYEAYNDASDLDGDGDLDPGYKPDIIDYYGYFDSYVCYEYNSGVFEPESVNPSTGAGRTKKCADDDEWSGDFLNYLTTSRIDALRKVFYGGSRSVDTSTTTVLSRAVIPQDAHSWAKEYSGLVDGYDIGDYSPLDLPTGGRRHFLASVTMLGDAAQRPLLRVRLNQNVRVWQWASTERAVLAGGADQEYVVRVRACVDGYISGAEAANCRQYPNGTYKPIGLLQKYGENDSMMFGLLSGSYGRNTEGGILRKNVGSITDEINATTGQFTATVGVIRTIDRLRVTGFGGSHAHGDNCGWITTRPINAGECRMWGNPIGEMMYEALRYFADKGAPTPAFIGPIVGTDDATLGLPAPTWTKPYETASRCSKPFTTVISDINPSFDTNSIPGTPFGAFTGDVAGLNAATATATISTDEGIDGTLRFIGQSGALYDGAPTPKVVASLANARGLAPEEPTKQGGYLSAGVAFWGNTNDINPTAPGRQQLQTFAVALASPLPRIEVPFDGRYITLVPFAKSVAGLGISAAPGAFQPTNTIVDFYYDRVASDPAAGKFYFRINYEDVEQGADHDMDAIVEYSIEKISATELRVRLNSTYAAGSIVQHMGYIISGTDGRDGIYLEVRDNEPSDVRYFLNTPNATSWPGASAWATVPMGLTSDRTFTVGSTGGATLLKDPLWYAAKWGGFVDSNNNRKPDLEGEWNQDDDPTDTPDNYFLVTNALRLSQQLAQAFDTILARASSASSVALNSGSLQDNSRVYQAKFNSDGWLGQLLSFEITATGAVPSTPEWDAAARLPTPGSRTIITRRTDGLGVPFRWTDLDTTMQDLLQPGGVGDTLGDERLDYLRGSNANEVSQGGSFRNRAFKLGDIVSSSPVFVGPPRFPYRDDLETEPYSAFRVAQRDRVPMVYAGANDGMLHGFHAGATADGGGVERLAYVPTAVYPKLHHLARQDYAHKFYVDGTPTAVDVFFGGEWRTALVGGLARGGQAIYALDVTDPDTFSESAADDILLWEFDDRVTGGDDVGDVDMGYSYSRPSVTKLRNGKWAAIFGNGYNSMEADGFASATGNAVLYVVDVETGAIIRKFDTLAGTPDDPLGQGRGNGMSSPAAVDIDGDNVSEYVYAGDLFGNLWKFDLTSTDPADWKISYTDGAGDPAPLYRARNALNQPQAIVSKPAVGRGPRDIGTVVLFGTGKYLEPVDRDVSAPRAQSFYGIYDRMTGLSTDRIVGRVNLVEQKISEEITETYSGNPLTLRVTTNNPTTSGARGWYMDLRVDGQPLAGEMQVSDSIIRAGRILFTTLIPSEDPCDAGGSGWFMALDALTGARTARPQFDLNEDKAFDDGDRADGEIVSGVKSGMGFIQRPGLLSDNIENRDLVIASGSQGGNPCGPQGQKAGAADDADCNPLSSQFGPFDRGRQSWRQLR